MASIGSLNASLKLESASFIRDLTKASQSVASNTSAMQRSLRGLQTGFDTAAGALKTFIAGFASIQTVRSLASLGADAIKTADDIATAANKLGVGAEALQRFRFAADQADVGTDQLDNALRVFAQNLAQGKIAAQGRDIGEAFQNYIEKIRQAPTQLEKFRLAQEAAGKQWQSLILLAQASGDAAKNAFVITQDALNKAGDLDNQIKALHNAAQTGFDTGFIEGFYGALDTTSERLATLNKNATAFGETVGKSFKAIADAVSSVADAYNAVTNKWNALPAPLRAALSTAFGTLTGGTAASAASNLFGADSADTSSMFPVAPYKAAADSVSALGDSFEAAQKQIGSWKTTIDVADISTTVKEWTQTFQSFGDVAANSFADAIVEGKKFSDTLNDLASQIEKMAISTALHQVFAALIGSPTVPGTPSTAGSGLLGLLLHDGGIVGSGGPKRSVPSIAFAGAPRFHSGFMPGEYPAILKKGEGVFTPDQMAALGGPKVQVNVVNNSGADVTQNTRQQGGLEIHDIIIGEVKRGFANRELDSSMALFGASRGTRIR